MVLNNGASQDMVLGLLYDQRTFIYPEKKILGQDLTFYSAEEVNIAFERRKIRIKCSCKNTQKIMKLRIGLKIIQTTAGRVLFNEVQKQLIYQ
jgi:DNA-directed RNA polymerase subunit beta'